MQPFGAKKELGIVQTVSWRECVRIIVYIRLYRLFLLQREEDFLQLMMEAQKGGIVPSTEVSNEMESQIFDIGSVEKPDATPCTRGLTEDEALAQCVLFFLAGQDTTSSTVSFAAVDRSAVEDYVLDERGIKVPKGCVVIVPVYAMHRDPEFFPEPETFKPESPRQACSQQACCLARLTINYQLLEMTTSPQWLPLHCYYLFQYSQVPTHLSAELLNPVGYHYLFVK
ncbi:hypothetical protein HPB48_027067 [Haemaphysalis longicornis]|uniref:Uncharacterized protein n=1 Tax=Haemaphysalis longicornis TaxID=44386 RepID=A0A9J6H2Z5_HAELO|nr:hypothetical protein HPB48_027067 [Haemaphysalis longicornis]